MLLRDNHDTYLQRWRHLHLYLKGALLPEVCFQTVIRGRFFVMGRPKGDFMFNFLLPVHFELLKTGKERLKKIGF